jgi:hypothetical protein
MTPPPPAAAASAAPAVHPRRLPPAPARRPRRVSGPLAAPAPAAPAPAAPASARGAARPASALIEHPLLDRLIHGRAWIGIVAFALIGIVTMQLGLLKLNAGIGRALEHEAALQRENSALSVENSEVAAGDTVELQAAHMGMQPIPSGSLRFLSAPASGSETMATTLARGLAALRARANGTSASSTASATAGESEATANASTTGASETGASATGASATGASETSSPAVSPSTDAGEAVSSTTSSGAGTQGTGTGTSAPSAGAPTESAAGAGAGAAASAPPPSVPTAQTLPSGEAGGASAGPQG